ncbi:MAG: PepSY domain-containing protein [Sulfuritalea sp.]|nr:PepSY domain-containing protein [Sulfuritalea sp.]MDP1981054.1 PepSY domain-containing protein [Sulfuritalea sp.]
MKRSTVISSIILASALAVGGGLPTPSFAGESRTAPAGERQWLSIPQVHEKLEAAGYRDIEKIERERGGYEARATDRNGERIKLYVNPQTGALLDRRAGRGFKDGDQRQRDSADCNKRRCRDDLPQKAATATPAAK